MCVDFESLFFFFFFFSSFFLSRKKKRDFTVRLSFDVATSAIRKREEKKEM